MNPFAARLSAYICLGLALALGIPPLFNTDAKREYLTKPTVFIGALALDDQNLAPVCGDKDLAPLGDDALAAYPAVRRALARLEANGGRAGLMVNVKSDDPGRLAAALGRQGDGRLCFRRGGNTFLLRPAPAQGVMPSYLVQVGAGPEAASGAPSLESLGLACAEPLPAWLCRGTAERPPGGDGARRQRAGAMRQAYYLERPSSAPPEAWRPFLSKAEARGGQARFTANGYLVTLTVREDSGWVDTELTGLARARMALGAVFLALGVPLLRRGYGKRPGIAVNPVGAVVVVDTVFVIAMGVLSAGPLYYALQAWLGLTPPMPEMDEALQFTLSIMYLPCLLIFAGMASNMGGQSLDAGAEGVALYGPFGRRFLPWEEISGLDLMETHVLVGRAGILLARGLQTKLVFKLTGEGRAELFEPGTASRKSAILAAVGRHAPRRLADDLARIEKEW